MFTSTNPLFVNLKLGMTERGNRLNPIYAKVQPASVHDFLNILFSSAISVAFLSDNNPAIGSLTLEIIFQLLVITIPP